MKKVRKIIYVMFLSMAITLIYTACNTTKAYAFGIKPIDDFDSLNGDAQYLGSDYRDNYYLDIEKTGLLDTGKALVNDLANALFGLIRMFTYGTVSIFYYAMDFDLGKLIGPQINAIQGALNDGIFKPMFLVGFSGIVVMVIKNLLKRNLIGSIMEVVKVIALIVFSYLLITQSSTILSYGTSLTKSIAVSALTGINNDKGTTNSGSYAADVSGVLWANLVHEPWITFEFGEAVGKANKASKETIEEFLSTRPGTEKREKLVEKYMEDNPDATCFDKKTSGWKRLPALFIYLIVALIKCLVYLLVVLIQIAFQAMAVLYLLLACVILVMAMMPGFGMETISSWLKKLVESQLGIIVITFILGLLVKFDSLLYALVPTVGWLVVMILQIAMIAGIVFGRKKILSSLSTIQKGVSNPAYTRAMLRRGGNPYEKIEKSIPTRNRSMNIKRSRPSANINTNNEYASGSESTLDNNSSPISRPKINTYIDFKEIKREPVPEIKKKPVPVREAPETNEINILDNSNVIDFSEYSKEREINRPRLYSTESHENKETPKYQGYTRRNYKLIRNKPAKENRMNLNSNLRQNVKAEEKLPRSNADPAISKKNYRIIRNAPVQENKIRLDSYPNQDIRREEAAAYQGNIEPVKPIYKNTAVERPSTQAFQKTEAAPIRQSTNATPSQNVNTPVFQSSDIPKEIKQPEKELHIEQPVKRPTTAPVSKQIVKESSRASIQKGNYEASRKQEAQAVTLNMENKNTKMVKRERPRINTRIENSSPEHTVDIKPNNTVDVRKEINKKTVQRPKVENPKIVKEKSVKRGKTVEERAK